MTLTHDELHREIRTTLARLSLISEASTQSFNSNGGRSCENPGGKRPPGSSKTADEWYRDRLADLDAGHGRRVPVKPGDKAKMRDTYEKLLGDAKRELEAITGRTDKAPQAAKAMDVKLIAEEDAPGVPADKLSDRLGVSPFQMTRWYVDWQLDPLTGESLSTEKADRSFEVARLAAQGMGERSIALALGVARGTVRKALGKAA